jgi:hypothetical protein
MAVQVEMRINGELIQTLHIGRIPGGAGVPGVVNEYAAVLRGGDEQPDWYAPDVVSGILHNYSDPLEVLVRRALDGISRADADELGAIISGNEPIRTYVDVEPEPIRAVDVLNLWAEEVNEMKKEWPE